MTTGKIEYAPDYKSKRRYPDPRTVFQGIERRAEAQLLKDEVIEKAKVWRRDMTHKSDADLVRAVDALVDFESQIKK